MNYLWCFILVLSKKQILKLVHVIILFSANCLGVEWNKKVKGWVIFTNFLKKVGHNEVAFRKSFDYINILGYMAKLLGEKKFNSVSTCKTCDIF